MGNMGMAMVEPETEPAAAAKAILDVCGPDPQKPLLLLGGVYRCQLLPALDIEVSSSQAACGPT